MAGKTARTDPKKRILDSAEKIFSGHGFEGASVRAIAAAAKVNLPTVYYHFGSKQGLVRAVLDRRGDPLRQEHLELLRRCEAEAGGQPLAVEKVLEAMLLPPLRLAASKSATHAVAMRLIGRIMAEPNLGMQTLLLHGHQETRKAFAAALARSLPGLPRETLLWRCEFAWRTLGALLCGAQRINHETKGACNPLDTPAVLAQLLRFLAPAFQAPA
jgi:AcrR family transcriptional regulator